MLIRHPILLLTIILLSVPIYRGVTLAVFGDRRTFHGAIRYWLARETWGMRAPLNEDWRNELRLFATVVLCIGFVAAVYSLVANYLA